MLTAKARSWMRLLASALLAIGVFAWCAADAAPAAAGPGVSFQGGGPGYGTGGPPLVRP